MTEQAPYRLNGRSSQQLFLRRASEGLVLGLVAINSLATQCAASALHYPPFLTGRIAGHLYQPFAWAWWQYRWPHSALQVGTRVVLLGPLWTACEHLVLYALLGLGALAGIASLFFMQPRAAADLHGSATWADAKEITKAGL
jgi:hypothetical protein